MWYYVPMINVLTFNTVRFGNGGPKVSVRRMFMDPYSLQANSSE